MEIAGELSKGREYFARQAWREAYGLLAAADSSAPLAPSDLELLAISSYMLGREQEYRERECPANCVGMTQKERHAFNH